LAIAAAAKQSGNTHERDPPGGREWNDLKSDPKAAPSRPPRQATKPLPRFKVSDLLGEEREAVLEHEGQEYRLRITANRKLILMK
jgi:hemin uptake protein HemP